MDQHNEILTIGAGLVKGFGKLLPKADIQLVIRNIRITLSVGLDIDNGYRKRVSVLL